MRRVWPGICGHHCLSLLLLRANWCVYSPIAGTVLGTQNGRGRAVVMESGKKVRSLQPSSYLMISHRASPEHSPREGSVLWEDLGVGPLPSSVSLWWSIKGFPLCGFIESRSYISHLVDFPNGAAISIFSLHSNELPWSSIHQRHPLFYSCRRSIKHSQCWMPFKHTGEK